MDLLSIPPPFPSDGGAAPPPAPAPAPAPAQTGPADCANCRKPGAALRCGICRKKTYCNRDCQRLDWTFHKRICEKPKDILGGSAAPAAARPAAPASASSSASHEEGAAAPTPAAPAKSSSGEVELDDEDLAAIADVRKKGYAYHARKLDAKELEMIGSIAPKAVASPLPVPLPTPAAAASAGTSSPAAAAAGSSSSSSGGDGGGAPGGRLGKASEWNTAGNTVEEKDMSAWARSRLKELLRARASELVLPLPGVGRLEVTGITGWAGSTADIVISRGKTRYILDFEPTLGFLVELVGDADVATGAADGGGDVSQPLLLSAQLALRDEGPDGEEAPRSTDGGAPAGAGAGAAASQPPTKRTKLPRAIVRFPDVSVDAAAATLEARVEWGKPAVKKDERELVTAAVHDGGLVDALRRVVQALVDEFRTK